MEDDTSGVPRSSDFSMSLQTAALQLRTAYGQGAIAPLREALAATDVDSAYVVQRINTDFWRRAGRRTVGQKIGLTSAVVQRQLAVDQPDFGILFDDMRIANGGALDPSRMLQPKVEGEVAFVLERDLDDPHVTTEGLAAAIAYAAPAIEIVDSRIQDWKITIADTIADNASSAFFVLGTEQHELAGLDLFSCGMVLSIDEAVTSIGAGAACLGHPLAAAAWLARTLSRKGEGLRAGDIIMSGALGPMVPLAPGNHVQVTIGGLGTAQFDYRSDPA